MAMDVEEQSAKPRKRRRRGWWVLLAVVGLLAVDYITYPWYAQPHGPSGDHGENGLWVRYTWYFGEWAPADVDRLASRMRDGGIKYAYCHVRDLNPDGTLRFHKAEAAKRLAAALHKAAPGVQLYAWVYAGTGGGRAVEMADAAVRANAVKAAKWLVDECGFDGIQWDYEVCVNRDDRLLKLLDDTRAALPDVLISVCAPLWTPGPAPSLYGWDAAYFGEVAQRCDQLAVMDYDTAMTLPRWYVACTREQVAQVTRAVQASNPACRVLIGVPTYEKGGFSHNAYAENLRLALIGVRDGLTDGRAEHGPFAGVALFADYTTSPEEWRTYRELWRTGP